jgi:hypothetical protein
MITHFNGFTSATMRAFGEELSAERVRRRELVEQTRSYTSALLESARRLRIEGETGIMAFTDAITAASPMEKAQMVIRYGATPDKIAADIPSWNSEP